MSSWHKFRRRLRLYWNNCRITETQCFSLSILLTVSAIYLLWAHANDLKQHALTIKHLPLVVDQHLEYAKTLINAPSESLSEPAFPFPFTLRDGQSEWLPQIQEELQPFQKVNVHDVEGFVKRLQTSMPLNTSCQFRVVYLRGGDLLFDDLERQGCTRNAKLNLFDKHLRSVVRMAGRLNLPLPDAAFVLSISADGVNWPQEVTGTLPPPESWFATTVPVFVIAKRNRNHLGVRIPNMYFGDIERSWARNSGTVLQIEKQRPWSTRAARAYWRGNCGHTVNASWPRVQLLALALTHPNQTIDAALTEEVHFPMDTLPPSTVLLVNRLPVRPRSHQLVQSSFKYLLNMPGSSTGSYSKNLQGLWPHGSVVLQWESDAVEFYYDKLAEGRTHLEVSADTLIERLNWLKENDAEAREIAENGLAMFQKYLSPSSLVVYWTLLLQQYSQLQGHDAISLPDHVCTCQKEIVAEVSLGRRMQGMNATQTGPHMCSFCDHWLSEAVKNTDTVNSYLFYHGYSTK